MKKIIASFIAMLFATAGAYAAPLALGTQELRLDGGLDFDSAAGTDLSLTAGYGYFIEDYIEVGGLLGISDNDFITALSVGAFGEYNIDTATEAIPFLGAQLRLIYADIDTGASSDSETALALGVYAGMKFFLTDGLAISGRLLVELASEEIYVEEDKVNDVDVAIDFGLRYFF